MTKQARAIIKEALARDARSRSQSIPTARRVGLVDVLGEEAATLQHARAIAGDQRSASGAFARPKPTGIAVDA